MISILICLLAASIFAAFTVVSFAQDGGVPAMPLDVKQIVKRASEAFADRDFDVATKLYRQAAELGDANAQQYIGVLYFNGQGLRQDYAEGLKWIGMAADRGNAAAQRTLGQIYSAGQGVKQDYVAAAEWLRKASNQGDRQAQHDLGLLYSNGHGVTRDYAQALDLWRKAAARRLALGSA